VREAKRPIDRLGASGIRFSSVNGRPISAPEFLAVFETMTRAIWRSKGAGCRRARPRARRP